MMTDYDGIINWDNLFKKSEIFKKNKPFKFAYVEEIFERDFYEKLYNTFPKYDSKKDSGWTVENMFRRPTKAKIIQGVTGPNQFTNDPTISKEWNKFIKYTTTKEFIDNFAKFSGIKISEALLGIGFFANTKGDFQLPHIDYDGKYPNKLQLMWYFAKNWQKGDPGGTYISTGEDESSIIFEPYNLDNSMLIFEETKKSWHGTRYIMKDNVVRQAVGFGFK